MLEIFFLGQFNLKLDGNTIKIPSRNAQSLLAYLLLNKEKRIRREMIAGVLWPEVEERKARDRLRYAIWQLRKGVGDLYITADKIDIAFNAEADYWFDAGELEGLIPGEASTSQLVDAAKVYQGELLPGFYDDWIVWERERLAASFEAVVGLLLKRLAAEERWRELVEWAEGWISLGETPEPAFQALMVAHCRLGDIASSVKAYHRCREMLSEHLDVQPSTLTEEMYEQLASGECPQPMYISQAATGQDRSVEAQAPPQFPYLDAKIETVDRAVFVGREGELRRLEDTLKRVGNAGGTAVFVVGDAGRGKTTLLQEFSRRAAASNQELILLWGSGETPTGLGDPFLPFRDILAMLTGDLESNWSKSGLDIDMAKRLIENMPQACQALLESGPDLIDSFVPGDLLLKRAKQFGWGEAAWLRQLDAFLSGRRNRPAPINIQHSDIQNDLFEQFTRVMQRLAQQRPLVIVLDDLQWADPASIDLLFHFGRRISGYPILLLISYRPFDLFEPEVGDRHPLVQVLSEFRRTFGEKEIDLDEYDEESGRSFIDAFLDSEPNNFGDDFRKALLRHTGGSPLFLVELLRQMEEKGEIVKDSDGCWVESRVIDWTILPEKVEAVIAGNIGQLPSQLEKIIHVAAVEGEEFTAQVISRAAGIEEDEVVSRLSGELAARHRIVLAQGIMRANDHPLYRYRFRHNLFYRFVCDSLDAVERAYLHRKVADALEDLFGEERSRIGLHLARHYEAAGMLEKASDYLLLAGEQAKRLSDNREAISHLRHAIGLLNSLPVKPDILRRELALNIALGAPLVAIEGYTSAEAEETFERARELCEQVADARQLPTALWGLWSFYLVLADFRKAADLAEQILELAQKNADTDLLLVGNWTLGITQVHLGHIKKAAEKLEQAINLYDPARHYPLTYQYGQNPAVTCLVYSAICLYLQGYPDQALARCQRAMRLAEEGAHDYSLAFASGMVSLFYALMHDVDQTVRQAQRTISLSRKAGFPFLLAMGMVTGGWARRDAGKEVSSIRRMKRGLGVMQTMGAELGRPVLMVLLIESQIRARQIEEGLRSVSEAFTFADRNNEQLFKSDLYRLEGELLALQETGTARIEASFLKAIALARGQEARLLELRALVSLCRYQLDHGLDSRWLTELADLHGWFSEGFDVPVLVSAEQLLRSTK